MKHYKLILIAVLAVAVVYTGVLSGMRLLEARQVAAMGQLPVTIVIDAGHGGEDGGAVSPNGVLESQLNLSVARRMDDFLAFCGFDTKMVRESDVSIYDADAGSISDKKISDLKNRVKLVNATPNALLLSIHQNKFPDGRYSGAQVFYAQTSGSKELAAVLQQTLIDVVDPQNHRQEKPADAVYLMKKIGCTGVLVECGFLSNVGEAARLQDPAYQKKLTLAMVKGLSGWLSEELAANEV